jgi:mannan endo-1,4-beta-mannosidase
VVGTDIVDPDGNVFYPIGANVAIKFTPYGYVFEGNNGGVNDHLADVSAWNWNTIRATLICDNDSGVPSFDGLVDGIGPTIERFTSAGVVVILECHDSTGRNVQLGSAKDLRIRRFWDEMASRYRDNPYVWFNIYNEPYASADGVSWARLHQFYVDRIRAAGAENVIVADLPVWAQGIDLLASQSFADGLNRACNTVFGWHAYGAVANRQASVADYENAIRRVQAKGMAVIIGEYGVALPENWGNAGPWAWNVSGFEAATTLGPRYGIGLLWWHATGDDAYFSLYSLKRDRSGFWTAGNSGNLTSYGQAFWDVSHQVSHSRGAFTGDLSASGCASAR